MFYRRNKKNKLSSNLLYNVLETLTEKNIYLWISGVASGSPNQNRDQCYTTPRDREGFAYPKVMHIHIEIQKKIKSDYFCAKKTNLSLFFF